MHCHVLFALSCPSQDNYGKLLLSALPAAELRRMGKGLGISDLHGLGRRSPKSKLVFRLCEAAKQQRLLQTTRPSEATTEASNRFNNVKYIRKFKANPSIHPSLPPPVPACIYMHVCMRSCVHACVCLCASTVLNGGRSLKHVSAVRLVIMIMCLRRFCVSWSFLFVWHVSVHVLISSSNISSELQPVLFLNFIIQTPTHARTRRSCRSLAFFCRHSSWRGPWIWAAGFA